MFEKNNADQKSKNLKYFSLVCLVVQSTSMVLLTRYSRTVGTLYMSSTAVFLAELLKLAVCFFICFLSHGNDQNIGFVEHMRLQLIDKESLKLSIPAGLYAIQNNLLFFALSNLDSATYAATYQLKLLTTAMFSVVMLKKQLSLQQWLSLLVLMGGVILVQLQPPTSAAETLEQDASGRRLLEDADSTPNAQNPFLGLCAILCACFASGFSGVYFEKILKGSKTSVWVRNIQLSFFGALFSAVVMLFNDGGEIRKLGFFYGYTPLVWCVVVNQGLSGLVVASVVRYADNIVKGFGSAISIVIGSVLSVYIFGVRLSNQFVLGAALVVSSVFIYSSGVKLVGWKQHKKLVRGIRTP